MKWARDMTTDELLAEKQKLDATWDEMRAAADRGEELGGGSPFEHIDERLGEIEFELKQREPKP